MATANQELQAAFARFNQVSEQLTGSYEGLEQQVNSLTDQLVNSKDERLRLLDQVQSLKEELRRSDRLSSMGEMTARLAHQIRTPLSTSLIYASQLSDLRLNEVRHEQFVSRLLDGLHNLDQVTNDMLLFTGGSQKGGERVSLTEVLTLVQKSLLPQLKKKKAIWNVAIDNHLDVNVHQAAFVSALGNLAQNALNAGESGVQLNWFGSRIGNQMRLVLQDNGSGIPNDIAEQIFDPFFTTRANGSGLGLAVVRAVVTAHGGTIDLDQDIQSGSRFVLCLPIESPQQILPSEYSISECSMRNDHE